MTKRQGPPIAPAERHRPVSALASLRSVLGHLRPHVSLAWCQEQDVYVAGLEGRYYVRGGLDTRYADPLSRDLLALQLLTGEELQSVHLNAKERSAVATAFLLGWVHHQGRDLP